MKISNRWLYGVVALAVLTPGVRAQVPGAAAAPPAGAPPLTNTPGVPGAVPGAPVPGGRIGNLIALCQYCRAKLCASPLGQLVSNASLPLGVLTGGIVQPLCPPNAVNPEDLKKPATSAEGAAARIKADEAGAKARVAAVRYLATVDCHYWPEAELALASALRTDRNECVRLAAAQALATGCCCTKTTVEALSITVSGSNRDGNPAENCPRVKAAALVALHHCLDCLGAVEPPPALPIVTPPVPKNGGEKPEQPGTEKPEQPPKSSSQARNGKKPILSAYYRKIERVPMNQVVHKARAALMGASGSASAMPVTRSGQRGLIQILTQRPTPTVDVEPDEIQVVQEPEPPTPVPVPASRPVILSKRPSLLSCMRRWFSRSPKRPVPAPAPLVQPTEQRPVPTPVTNHQDMKVSRPATPTPYAPASVEQPRPLRPRQSSSRPTEGTKIKPISYTRPVPAKATPVPPSHEYAGKPASPKSGSRSRAWIEGPVSRPQPATPPSPVPSPYYPKDTTAFATHYPAHLGLYQVPSVHPDTPIDVSHLLAILHGDVNFTYRERAALWLATVEEQDQPRVVEALLQSARKDQAAAVRAACAQSLGRMSIPTVPVYNTLCALRKDADPRVRNAANEALEGLARQFNIAIPRDEGY
jgi:hypothetical protein